MELGLNFTFVKILCVLVFFRKNGDFNRTYTIGSRIKLIRVKFLAL